MTTLRHASKRAQPRLGTLLRVTLEHDGVSDQQVAAAFDDAFAEAARLEEIFSLHSPTSELSRFNARAPGSAFHLSPELEEALARADHFREISGGVFEPWRDGRLDLTGLAKGFIVDRLAVRFAPEFAGVIDAGGDLRFFGRRTQEPRVHVRTGPADNPRVFELHLEHFLSVATSGPQAALIHADSSTRYDQTPTKTASVVALDCTTADALTKVALFGASEQIEACCEELDAAAFVFSPEGTLETAFGVA